MAEKNMDNLIEAFNKYSMKLVSVEPGSKEFNDIFSAITGIHEIIINDEKVHNDWLDQARRFDIEEEKIRINRMEAANRERLAKREIVWRLVQAGFTVIGAIICIWLTGHIEETKLISQKCFGFVNWFRPKLI